MQYKQGTRRGVEQLAARRAHNPKVTGSSPVPATKNTKPLICDQGLFNFRSPRFRQALGSVDVSFTAAFGPVLGLNKEKIATWYEYHQRFLTPCSPKNGLNPKGWAGKWPFTALCSLEITRYCLRRMPCA
jgi:hypothetical protein